MKLKNRYNFTNYLDKLLKELEFKADKANYKIDNDIFYIECCSIITDAEFKHNSLNVKINSKNFWKFYNLALWNIENKA